MTHWASSSFQIQSHCCRLVGVEQRLCLRRTGHHDPECCESARPIELGARDEGLEELTGVLLVKLGESRR
jgi:hypothetical protein